jgi:hypothetical protein
MGISGRKEAAKIPVNEKLFLVTIMLASLSIILSCTGNPLSGTTKIIDIVAKPSKYTDKLVRVRGKVTESFIIFGQGYFVIADDTGEIAVVPTKTYPKAGEAVAVRGIVKNAFVIGDKSLTVIIEGTGGK